MSNKKGIRVTFDAPDPEPRKNKDMNVWKCYSCQKRFNGLEPDMRCPHCKKLTQWILISVLSGGQLEEVGGEVQDMRGKYELKTVLGVKGSSRPCMVPTCAGQMYAYMHLYRDGGFRLIFTCERCHQDFLPGVGSATTSEPQTAEEALA